MTTNPDVAQGIRAQAWRTRIAVDQIRRWAECGDLSRTIAGMRKLDAWLVDVDYYNTPDASTLNSAMIHYNNEIGHAA